MNVSAEKGASPLVMTAASSAAPVAGNVKTQVARGLKWQLISIAGNQLLSFVVFITLARLLEPADFGLLAIVGVYLGFVSMFVDQGIGAAVIQRQDVEPEHKDAAFWFNVGCAAVLCLGTLALAGPVAALYHEPRLARLLQWSSVGLLIGASSGIHATLFTKAMDFRRPVLRGLIANTAGGITGIIMAVGGCGVWSLVGQQLIGAATGAIFLWTMSDYRPALGFSWRHLRELLGFSSSVFATSILWYITSRLDQIVIGQFAGVQMLGLYAMAGKVPNLATTITQQPLAAVSLPSFSSMQNDHAKMCRAIYSGMEMNAAVSFAVFVGLAAIAPTLVPLLFGLKWTAAAGFASLLSIYALISALHVFCHPALLASGGAGKYVLVNVWYATGAAVVCLVGVRFGVTELLLGLIGNSLLVTIPALLYLRSRIGMDPLAYCKPCLMPALASLFMVAMIWLTAALLPRATAHAWRLACQVCLGGATYLGCMALLAPAVVKKIASMVRGSAGRS